MRTKMFLISLLSFMIFLLVSGFLIYSQMKTIKGLNLEVLEDKLYTENTVILGWSLKNVNLDRLGQSSLPSSWGEIMVVDNSNLVISASTNHEHVGKSLSTVPELLDQATPVIEAMKRAAPENIRTHDYMIALSPLAQNSSLIGFKPKSWERGLISQQNDQIKRNTENITTILIFYLAGGLVFAVIISLVITFTVSRPIHRVAEAFEQLSFGDLDTELPRSGGKTMVRLSDSFFRLRTSLKYALERLGSR
jgi:methyl-accepting chemotaxis protein